MTLPLFDCIPTAGWWQFIIIIIYQVLKWWAVVGGGSGCEIVSISCDHCNQCSLALLSISLLFASIPARLLIILYSTNTSTSWYHDIICIYFAVFVSLSKVCQMLWWMKNSPHCINIRGVVTTVVPMYSIFQAPSHEPKFSLLASFLPKPAYLNMQLKNK